MVALSVPDAAQVPCPEDVNPEVSPTAQAKPKSLVSSTFTKHCDDAQLLFADARVLPFKMAVGPTVFWTWLPPHDEVMTARISKAASRKHLDIIVLHLSSREVPQYTILSGKSTRTAANNCFLRVADAATNLKARMS